jgi:hypothetical protein
MYELDVPVSCRKGVNCPHCRAPINTADLTPEMTYFKNSCVWTMFEGEHQTCGYCDAEFISAFDLDKHVMTTCPRALIECSHEDCDARIAREDMPAHVESHAESHSPHFVEAWCEACGDMHELIQDHREPCPEPCPECSMYPRFSEPRSLRHTMCMDTLDTWIVELIDEIDECNLERTECEDEAAKLTSLGDPNYTAEDLALRLAILMGLTKYYTTSLDKKRRQLERLMDRKDTMTAFLRGG